VAASGGTFTPDEQGQGVVSARLRWRLGRLLIGGLGSTVERLRVIKVARLDGGQQASLVLRHLGLLRASVDGSSQVG
jgi:hypothetical protein